MDRTVEEIEDLRLKELQKQAAMFGPNTEPAILIEIQELTHKQRVIKGPTRREFVNQLDYDFLMNTVSATLLRFNTIVEALNDDKKKRYLRQLIHDLWMITITIIVVVTLVLQLYRH
jgi:hypothetical protein